MSTLSRHALTAGIYLFSFLLFTNSVCASKPTQAFLYSFSTLLGYDATSISGRHTYASAYRSQVYMNAERA